MMRKLGTLVMALGLGLLPSWTLAAPTSVSYGTLVVGNQCKAQSEAKLRQYCLGDPVLGQGSPTFLDLLKLVYPDLKADGKASYSKELRKSFAGFSDGQDTPSGPGQALFSIEPMDILILRDAGKSRLLALDPRTGTLAYLQIEPIPKLLDLIGVSQDQNVNLASDFPAFEVRTGQYAFITNSWHFNSAEAFNIYNLFMTSPDQLIFAYDGPFLYSFSLPENQECRLEQRLASLKALPSQHEGYADLSMEVEEAKSCPKGEKQVLSAKRRYPMTLLWQSSQGKYMGGSKELYLRNKCRQDGRTNCG